MGNSSPKCVLSGDNHLPLGSTYNDAIQNNCQQEGQAKADPHGTTRMWSSMTDSTLLHPWESDKFSVCKGTMMCDDKHCNPSTGTYCTVPWTKSAADAAAGSSSAAAGSGSAASSSSSSKATKK